MAQFEGKVAPITATFPGLDLNITISDYNFANNSNSSQIHMNGKEEALLSFTDFGKGIHTHEVADNIPISLLKRFSPILFDGQSAYDMNIFKYTRDDIEITPSGERVINQLAQSYNYDSELAQFDWSSTKEVKQYCLQMLQWLMHVWKYYLHKEGLFKILCVQG